MLSQERGKSNGTDDNQVSGSFVSDIKRDSKKKWGIHQWAGGDASVGADKKIKRKALVIGVL